ncbi:MAG: hypothetical protein HY909_04285 [Deltaproteobacteria bacterium]|nr:hypothetical protein [Deltaproteobacteria bacterium]
MGGNRYLLGLCLALLPAVASAQPGPQEPPPGTPAQTHLDRGNTLYQQQRYAEAAREFQAAYDQSHHAALLYNIARALEAAGELRGALDAYRRFDEAGAPGADPQGLQTLRDRIASLRARLGEGGTTAPTPAPPTAAPQPQPTPHPPGEDRAPPSRLGSWLLLGGGVACAGASVAFAVLASGNSARVRAGNLGQEPYSLALEDARSSAQLQSTLAWTLGLAGGALLTGGVLGFLLRSGAPRPGAPRALVLPTPGGLGLGVGGTI